MGSDSHLRQTLFRNNYIGRSLRIGAITFGCNEMANAQRARLLTLLAPGGANKKSAKPHGIAVVTVSPIMWLHNVETVFSHLRTAER